ncbi:F0F1-type ATP synthase assembly protein I [Mucilaginibacter sp. UYNi724]
MNQAINFFWTIICFIPVIAFWWGAGAMQLLYVLIFISVLSLVVPARVLQLSKNPKFYEGLGVRFIRKWVQNGEFANRISRRKNPRYKLIKNRAHATQYQRTIVMYERYHFMCFIFFLLTAAFAFVNHSYLFFATIFIANIIYNICPILLQQYNRARVLRVINSPGK